MYFLPQVAGIFRDPSIGEIKVTYVIRRIIVLNSEEVSEKVFQVIAGVFLIFLIQNLCRVNVQTVRLLKQSVCVDRSLTSNAVFILGRNMFSSRFIRNIGIAKMRTGTRKLDSGYFKCAS